ncbi:mannose-1-phosphate guanylyltransferase/mannose-6-phosphate isomerase [Frigidibacter sp. ROC022]|uniref:mannose-1-phosphate guanylyltransferase/mannose-6-phosphate isomerase n=1 Tax=Frigidibacter sp. ROC022 TaxID=2971796 RepID=UPI00215A30D3|nr:mannose-1-phosphate guanylyltransferase/mannose-6-phosphate isomerase [Frigidibacter sp. ROC022]MCR8726786.1 mannose-1-phosphate guanylyltransferase/mannose-6-phosphate isomerase [Frigidibacter sp. ROC022]
MSTPTPGPRQLYPVLLCGGSGTRLWPLSRAAFPKQFANIVGDETSFQASARRLTGPLFHPPTIVTGADFRFIVTEQLLAAGIDPGVILLEPETRDTAPAVLAAALHLVAEDPEAVLLVAPSDHVIADMEGFQDAIVAGLDAVAQGRLVTFGIAPDRPETGYGWLELDGPAPDNTPVPLARYVEKPDRAMAESMLASGHFLWNTGIFLFTARDIIAAYEEHQPKMTEHVRQSIAATRPDLNFLRLASDGWTNVETISIDYAVMEKAQNLSVVAYHGSWSDLGDWHSVAHEMQTDARGVARSGPATAIDCDNTLLRAESSGQRLVGFGLENIIAIAMPDAVLVADSRRAQDVKLVVSRLRDKDVRQADTFLRDHRPWGWFETLALADRFQVKRIVVHPGAALSLQSHHHRSEHWIVVSGTAKVTVDDQVKLLTENESVYIPLGAVHRMENPGKVPMVLIEVQTGTYLGEDDIIRYEDVYSRGQGAKG